MKTSLKLLAVIAALPLASLNAAVLVQWGETGVGNQGATDIVTGNVNYAVRTNTFTAGAADNPTVDANYYPNATGRSPIFAAAASLNIANGLIGQAASGDRLTYYQTIATGLTFRSMTMWSSTNFLSSPTGMTFDSVTMNIGARDVTNINAGARVIVQQGASYYVTDAQSFVGGTPQTLAFNLTTATWFNFTPFVSGVEVIGSSATVSLTDIEGIGFYATVENGALVNTATGSQASYFQATAVPEPATWALLAGSLTCLVVLRRRRL